MLTTETGLSSGVCPLSGCLEQSALRRSQVIHADGNESNILVDDQRGAVPRVTGILDFGDFGHSWRVAEPAILLLYVLLLAKDPVTAAVATLVRPPVRQLNFFF